MEDIERGMGTLSDMYKYKFQLILASAGMLYLYIL